MTYFYFDFDEALAGVSKLYKKLDEGTLTKDEAYTAVAMFNDLINHLQLEQSDFESYLGDNNGS